MEESFTLRVIEILKNLPWHRVINSKGYIAIKDHEGFNEQKIRLEKE